MRTFLGITRKRAYYLSVNMGVESFLNRSIVFLPIESQLRHHKEGTRCLHPNRIKPQTVGT